MRIPKNFTKYKPIVDKWLTVNSVDRSLWGYVYALVNQESGWNPNAFRAEPQIKGFGDAGDASYGLFQILQSTAYGLGFRGSNFDLYDPDTNARWATMLFAKLWRQYGNITDVLAAYNSGRAYQNAPAVTKNEYVPSVLAMAPEFTKLV